MAKFTTVQEWLATKPAKAEVTKVLNVINKGETSRLRQDMYQSEDYLRKLNRSVANLTKMKFPIPAEMTAEMEKTTKKIEELKKVVPVVKIVRKKKVAEEPKVEEPAQVEEQVAEEVQA